jgi:hypothetical protein
VRKWLVYLERLRNRELSAKRSLALRECALGVEALERFVRTEPLRRVHECVFGVLALESAAVAFLAPAAMSATQMAKGPAMVSARRQHR